MKYTATKKKSGKVSDSVAKYSGVRRRGKSSGEAAVSRKVDEPDDWRKLSPADLARRLVAQGGGTGNYTEERRKKMDKQPDITVEELVEQMLANTKKIRATAEQHQTTERRPVRKKKAA